MIVDAALKGMTLKRPVAAAKLLGRPDLKRANFCRFFGSATGLTGQ